MANKYSRVPSANNANAASVGANTVKGPSPLKVSAKPAAITAASNVVWSGEPTITSTTVFEADALTITSPTIPDMAWP